MPKKHVPLWLILPLAAGILPLRADQTRAAAKKAKCPDVAVTSMKITLLSTLVDDPEVEFPLDTVRVEAVLESVGSKDIPAGALLYVMLKRNGKVVHSTSATDALGPPGSRWNYCASDSFVHGRKTVYLVEASAAFRECRLDNNRASLTVDEKKLHEPENQE